MQISLNGAASSLTCWRSATTPSWSADWAHRPTTSPPPAIMTATFIFGCHGGRGHDRAGHGAGATQTAGGGDYGRRRDANGDGQSRDRWSAEACKSYHRGAG